MKKWEDIPDAIKKEAVRSYHTKLYDQKKRLFVKRIFDFIFALLLSVIIVPVILVLAGIVKKDSKGPAFFLQTRLTQYGRSFNIIKLRTMVTSSEHSEVQVTSKQDVRITKVGAKMRKYRLDELPQIFNVLKGDMTFVGTRPETPRYVAHYTDEMLATLLLPAGVTSAASIHYKDEDELLEMLVGEDIETCYIQKVLPEKMKYNLDYLKKFSLKGDLRILKDTIRIVFGKKRRKNKN